MTPEKNWRHHGVTLVIPALNEERAVESTIREARTMFANAGASKYEIILVNDGSDDRTGELAELAGARVIQHPHNVGYGRSLKDGIIAASYDTIVIADADATYPIERIPDLLELYDKGFEMVVGQREGKHLNQTVMKSPLRRLLRFLVEYASGRKVLDVNSGLRVFSRSTILKYFPRLCETFSFTTSATLAYMMNGRFVTYMPISYNNRIGTTKVRLLKESLRTLQYIIQAITYYNPLKLFMLLSVLCFLAAAGIICLSVIFQVVNGFVLGVGTILVGMVVFVLGLVTDVLRQLLHGNAGANPDFARSTQMSNEELDNSLLRQAGKYEGTHRSSQSSGGQSP